MIVLYILLAVSSFVAGYLIAERRSHKNSDFNKNARIYGDTSLTEEYRNFLSYDGSEQI